jgi:hypothetical protein
VPAGIPASALNVCSPTDNIQIQTKSFEVGGVKFTFETSAGKQSSISGNSGTSAIKLTVDKTNAKGKGEVKLNEKIKVLSVAELFGKAIGRIRDNGSISTLFINNQQTFGL